MGRAPRPSASVERTVPRPRAGTVPRSCHRPRPYDVPLRSLGKSDARAGHHGLGLTLHTGWDTHCYGNIPTLILTPDWSKVPYHPPAEDLIRAARQLPHRC